MYKRVFVIAAALCAAAAMTVGTIASASGDAGKKVNFVIHSQVPVATGYVANPIRCTFTSTGNVASPCVVPITPTAEPTPGAYNDQVTGDLVGHGQFAGSAVLATFINTIPATLDIPYTSYEPYTVTIQGCGTGTVIVRATGTLGMTTGGHWQFVPNSGRRVSGLPWTISGSGTFTTTDLPTGLSVRTSEGKVRCK